MNLDRARLQLDGLPVARQIIGSLALDLDGGILWRDLFNYAREARQQGGNRLGRGPGRARPNHSAFSIVGVTFLAPRNREAIALAAVHHERNRFGGLAKRDRQPARGKWIERTGV